MLNLNHLQKSRKFVFDEDTPVVFVLIANFKGLKGLMKDSCQINSLDRRRCGVHVLSEALTRRLSFQTYRSPDVSLEAQDLSVFLAIGVIMWKVALERDMAPPMSCGSPDRADELHGSSPVCFLSSA